MVVQLDSISPDCGTGLNIHEAPIFMLTVNTVNRGYIQDRFRISYLHHFFAAFAFQYQLDFYGRLSIVSQLTRGKLFQTIDRHAFRYGQSSKELVIRAFQLRCSSRTHHFYAVLCLSNKGNLINKCVKISRFLKIFGARFNEKNTLRRQCILTDCRSLLFIY